jgi:hypothetical protein
MTGIEKFQPKPSNPTPAVVAEVFRTIPTRQLLGIRCVLIENPRFNATRIEVLDKILAERGYESLYSGPQGPRCAARDHALHLAETRGVKPFCWSEKYGQMYATDVDSDGVVTYKAASAFTYA